MMGAAATGPHVQPPLPVLQVEPPVVWSVLQVFPPEEDTTIAGESDGYLIHLFVRKDRIPQRVLRR